jgi:outer membrane scaffolding protein for murein synthesis (MipA/OmpV family)
MTLLQQNPANRTAQARTALTPAIRPRAIQWAYLLLAGLALPSAAAWAQIKPTADDSAATSGGFVGLGVGAAPRYQGSDESKTSGIPAFEYRWANGVFVGGTDGLIGVQLNATPQLQLGLALGMDEGRKASESRYLAGMGDIDTRGTLNLSAKATINEQFGLSTGLQLGAGSSGKGGLLNLGASYGVTLAPATRMTFNVGATLANADYMQDYFGVSAAQARTSGYKRYTPDSGLRDVTVGVGVMHQFSRKWMLITSLNSTTLSNAAKDSPLVRKATSQSAFAAVAYSF